MERPPVTYRRRRRALSRGEREWRVEADALASCGVSGRVRRYSWSEIVSLRLCRAPARYRPWRYVFELQPKHARKIVIDNAHFVSSGNFEDRSVAFTAFVRAAVSGAASANPKLRVLIGETPKRYFFLLLMALLGLGAVAYALTALRTPIDNMPYANAIKFGIVVVMLPVFGLWVVAAMPRGVAPDSIPERALPPAPGEGEG